VAGGLLAGALWSKGVVARAAIGIGALWLAFTTLSTHPDELAYANELGGGPARLWRHLADSNVDWGQDLPALAREVSKRPLRTLYLGYFGTADPRAQDLRYRWIPSMPMIEKRNEDGPDPEGREWIALSVTTLVEVYTTADHESYRWLRERPFTAFPGSSIALFDITGDAPAHRKLGEVAIHFGEPEAAEQPLRRAVELDPRDAETRVRLAGVLATLARKPEAIAQCDEAERLRPEPAIQEPCAAIRAAP